MDKCAFGTPLNGRDPCPKCGAEPNQNCGPHYAQVCDENEKLKLTLGMWRDEMKEAVRKPFFSVFLDGRNEHGSHVLSMPGDNIPQPKYCEEIVSYLEDQDDGLAERIIDLAENMGFEISHCVVTTWRFDSVDDYLEWDSISWPLTALLFGTPDEQRAEHERAATSPSVQPVNTSPERVQKTPDREHVPTSHSISDENNAFNKAALAASSQSVRSPDDA